MNCSWYCFNYSSIVQKQGSNNFPRYFVLFYKNIEQDVSRKEDLKGWKAASTLCEKIGGTLPIFHSTTELNDFLALMRSQRWMVSLEAVYIGLQYSTEVRNNSYLLMNMYCTNMWQFYHSTHHTLPTSTKYIDIP